MCPFCHHHPPVGKGCGHPHVTAPVSPKVTSRCSTTIPPIEKGNQDFQNPRISVCRDLWEEFSESRDPWHGCQMFIHCISTQQAKGKTNHKEQFKEIPKRTEVGTLMVTFLQLLVSYFQRQTAKVIREIPWIGPAAFLKANGTGQCHGIPVLFSCHRVRTATPKLEPVVKYFTKYMNSCCNSFVYFPFLFQ